MTSCRADRLALILAAHALTRCLAQLPLPPENPAAFPPPSQVRLPLTGPVPPGQSAVERAEALKPIAWLHVPKDGSSFLNTVMHNPTVCPNMPADRYVPVAEDPIDADGETFAGAVPYVLSASPVHVYCPGAFSYTAFTEWDGRNHGALGSFWDEMRGRVVTMLRQPEQRLVSAFHYDTGSPNFVHQGYHWQPGEFNDLYEYAIQWQGCATKMITRGGHPCFDLDSEPPSAEETALAIERLRTGFAFVGILEEWELSVCLYHAMFGGWCEPAEFGNMRMGPGRTSSDTQYDTSELRGWTEPSDGPLYAEAVRIFNENLERFGVTHENCPSFCQPPPDQFGTAASRWTSAQNMQTASA